MDDNCMGSNYLNEKCESVDPDIQDGNNISNCGLMKNGLILRPVVANESGSGLPYAPEDWPRPGDIWRWKAGNRKYSNGFWRDRCLYLPTRLHKSLQRRTFKSKLAVERYIREEFPDADINAFLSSFSWTIPSPDATVSKGESTISSINSTEQMTEHFPSKLKVRTVECKAGNWMCQLQREARKFSVPAVDCDICCSEAGFCRDCCCILCCGFVDWSYGSYSFIRCEAKVNDGYICGHVAHVNCALRSNLAGTVGENIGLDVEYYCRRCDKRSDLIRHATRIFQTCKSLGSRDDIEKILNVGLCILGGSKQGKSKRLLHLIKLALDKLKSGCSLEDLWRLEGNVSVVSADEETHSGSNGHLHHEQPDSVPHQFGNMKQSQQPIASNNLIDISVLEDKVESALHDLRDSQENEYEIAEDCLFAKKDFILSLYKQLEKTRSELAKQTSSSRDLNTESLVTDMMNRTKQIKQEMLKLKDMEEVAKGFGRVAKIILKEDFGMQISE